VEVFDDAIAEFEHYGVAWKEIVPWVRVANSLRPSPLGTTENWDHQFQVARGYLTRHSTTHPGIVELMIPRAAAAFELEKLTSDQETLAEATTRRFEIRSRA
jgi:phosphoglycolate phosphatase-like HAD superfamily hydrolase